MPTCTGGRRNHFWRKPSARETIVGRQSREASLSRYFAIANSTSVVFSRYETNPLVIRQSINKAIQRCHVFGHLKEVRCGVDEEFDEPVIGSVRQRRSRSKYSDIQRRALSS